MMWVGFDDAETVGAARVGARKRCCLGWIQYMKVALKQRAPVDFPRPQGFITQSISKLDGLLAREDDPDPMKERRSFARHRAEGALNSVYRRWSPDAMLARRAITPTPTTLDPTSKSGARRFDASEGTP